jgi:hypothetical protein
MASAGAAWIQVGRFNRRIFRQMISEVRAWGGTVTYDPQVDVGLLSSIYYDIKVEGPEEAVDYFLNWIRQFEDEG